MTDIIDPTETLEDLVWHLDHLRIVTSEGGVGLHAIATLRSGGIKRDVELALREYKVEGRALEPLMVWLGFMRATFEVVKK